MKPAPVIVLVISGLLLSIGALTWGRGHRLDVYKSRDAWQEVANKTNRDSAAWYRQLPKVETAHKKLTDTGLSLVATGVSLPLLLAGYRWYQRGDSSQRGLRITLLWMAVWLAQIPTNLLYHTRCYLRGDYPPWADSIAIPFMTESVAYLFLALITSFFIKLVLVRKTCSESISLQPPRTLRDWLRYLVLIPASLLFLTNTPATLSSGDIGDPLVTFGSLLVFLVLLSAKSDQQEQADRSQNADEQTYADLKAKLYAKRTGVLPR